MVQKHVTEVKRAMNTLTMLRAEVTRSRFNVVKAIREEVRKLWTILETEEELYVEEHCPGGGTVAIYDDKLNALSEAIGVLEERMLFPKDIVKCIDDAVMKLQICTN